MNIILERLLVAWAGSFFIICILNYLTKNKLNDWIIEWEKENSKLNSRIVWIYIVFPWIIGAVCLIKWFLK